MQEHQTADPERRSHLLRKASTSVVSSKLREGVIGPSDYAAGSYYMLPAVAGGSWAKR